jgi:colicin import membrane protein
MSVVPLRQSQSFHHDPKFGRLLLVSLIAHGLIWAAFSFDLFGTSIRPRPPVYYVDLIYKPVLNPQAGRPDPRPASVPKAVPEKVTVQKATPPTLKEPVKPAVKPLVKPVQVKPTRKAEPKPEPKPAAKVESRPEQKVQSALDEIRERQARQAERDALVEKLARLRDSTAVAAALPTDVPVGMPDGRGNEVGVAVIAFVEAFIKQNWALSPYLIEQSRIANIEAKAALAYSMTGKLIRFRIDVPSGNQQFDDSLKRAIIKSEQLPQALPQDLELNVTFNLKDIAAARR